MLKIRQTYTSCSTLPLSVFIQVLINNRTDLLYTDKKTAWNKPADLGAIWDALFLEYTELSNDTRSIHVLSLMRDIAVINGKLTIIQNIVMLLATEPDLKDFQKSINILKTYGYRYNYSPETLINDLQRVVSSAKTLVIERDELQSDLNKLNENDTEKANEKDFYVNLANLSEIVGFAINPNDTTVMQYCGYLEIQRLKSKSNE